MLIEGESLLNDATAIVVFIVFRDGLVGVKESTPAGVLETAARMSLGGEGQIHVSFFVCLVLFYLFIVLFLCVVFSQRL